MDAAAQRTFQAELALIVPHLGTKALATLRRLVVAAFVAESQGTDPAVASAPFPSVFSWPSSRPMTQPRSGSSWPPWLPPVSSRFGWSRPAIASVAPQQSDAPRPFG